MSEQKAEDKKTDNQLVLEKFMLGDFFHDVQFTTNPQSADIKTKLPEFRWKKI